MYAFYKRNSPRSLTLQEYTAAIGDYAFAYCTGLTRSIYVTVQSQPVRTTKITGVPSYITLKVLGVQTLHPVLTPLTSTERITYASSNAKVADVNTRGRILALKKGNATITVQSGSQILKCRVLVK